MIINKTDYKAKFISSTSLSINGLWMKLCNNICTFFHFLPKLAAVFSSNFSSSLMILRRKMFISSIPLCCGIVSCLIAMRFRWGKNVSKLMYVVKQYNKLSSSDKNVHHFVSHRILMASRWCMWLNQPDCTMKKNGMNNFNPSHYHKGFFLMGKICLETRCVHKLTHSIANNKIIYLIPRCFTSFLLFRIARVV